MVGWNGMSFHSTQATSHALQPMQVVVSMSLQSSSSRCMPSPATGPGWAEICWICSVLRSPISRLLRFLKLHEEALEFRCVSIGIGHRRGESIGRHLRCPVQILGNPLEAPVNGKTDLVELFAVNHHW